MDERSFFCGLFFSALAHGSAVGGGRFLGNFFILAAEVALGGKTALSGDLGDGAIIPAQVFPGGSDPVKHQLLRR